MLVSGRVSWLDEIWCLKPSYLWLSQLSGWGRVDPKDHIMNPLSQVCLVQMLGKKIQPYSPQMVVNKWWKESIPWDGIESAPKIHQLNKIPEHGTLLMSMGPWVRSSKSWISPPKFNSESPWKNDGLEDYCTCTFGARLSFRGKLLNFQGVSLRSPWFSCWNCG